ncbi:developmental regulator protein [Apiospora kogelbergensis]|uniref:Developmental regulator protein n=1 Tax=Apiospora kogelbergensis TaxID=1337665 RepID=A0AAW0QGB8_9PEZI
MAGQAPPPGPGQYPQHPSHHPTHESMQSSLPGTHHAYPQYFPGPPRPHPHLPPARPDYVQGPMPSVLDRPQNGNGPIPEGPRITLRALSEGTKSINEDIATLADHACPLSTEKEDSKWKYKLVCVQQPQRARMCGFGDKDRRPITPPPCIRLQVIDKTTGREVSSNDVEHQMFILSVDLWSWNGLKEVNVVKHSQNSPSISSTTQQSFRELQEGGPSYDNYPGLVRQGYAAPSQPPSNYGGDQYSHGYGQPPNPEDKFGIWFILQDLSVRTEGYFRLRFSFTSVGIPGTVGDASTSDPQRVNQGKAPVLAQCFSDPFQVYSAKKFPGVCESTNLSKCFATQGIKIPIRKEGADGKAKRGKGSDDEDDD